MKKKKEQSALPQHFEATWRAELKTLTDEIMREQRLVDRQIERHEKVVKNLVAEAEKLARVIEDKIQYVNDIKMEMQGMQRHIDRLETQIKNSKPVIVKMKKTNML